VARWRVVLEMIGEQPDAHAARMEAFRLYGPLVVRVQSRVSDEIGEQEARTAKAQRRRLRFYEAEDE